MSTGSILLYLNLPYYPPCRVYYTQCYTDMLTSLIATREIPSRKVYLMQTLSSDVPILNPMV